MQNRIARYFDDSSSASVEKSESNSETFSLDIQQFTAFLKPNTSSRRTKKNHQKQQQLARRPSELGWILVGIGAGLLGGLALARLFAR